MDTLVERSSRSDPIRIRMREKRVEKSQEKGKVELDGVDVREHALV